MDEEIHIRYANRVGPSRAGPFGILQTLADGIKLFFKEDLIPNKADKFVFKLAPFFSIVPALLVFTVVPVAGDFSSGGDGTVTWFGNKTFVQLADPHRNTICSGHVINSGLRYHARRMVFRVKVPATRISQSFSTNGVI